IKDITHRLLCEKKFCEKADYNIASLRKWFPIPSGGLAVKQNGIFRDIPLTTPPTKLIHKKITAMKKKAIFVENNEGDKVGNLNKFEFLKLLSKFNSGIQFNYKNYTIDVESQKILNSIDVSSIKSKRRENVKYI